MSSAKPSKLWPPELRKRTAARDRSTSLAGLLKPGRYQATTSRPCACAASRNRATRDGRRIATDWLKFEVSTYTVATPRAAMERAEASGSLQMPVSKMSTQVARPRYGSSVAFEAAEAAGAPTAAMQARARIQRVLRATRRPVCTRVAFDAPVRRPPPNLPAARPGYGKIGWGFTVLPYGKGRSILVDECRTRVTDPVSRERFRRYWKLVGPGARYVMGRTVALAKRHAEEAVGA